MYSSLSLAPWVAGIKDHSDRPVAKFNVPKNRVALHAVGLIIFSVGVDLSVRKLQC